MPISGGQKSGGDRPGGLSDQRAVYFAGGAHRITAVKPDTALRGPLDSGRGPEFYRHRHLVVGCGAGGFASHWPGHLLERHRHLWRDGDWRAARRSDIPGGWPAVAVAGHCCYLRGGHRLRGAASGRKASRARPLPFRAVLGKIAGFGAILAMGSAGFGVIATFITLFYQDKGWEGAAFALSLFSGAFVGAPCCSRMRLTATAVCGSPASAWRLKPPDCFWWPQRVIPGWQKRAHF